MYGKEAWKSTKKDEISLYLMEFAILQAVSLSKMMFKLLIFKISAVNQ
jgi:hypothetical protein